LGNSGIKERVVGFQKEGILRRMFWEQKENFLKKIFMGIKRRPGL